MIDKVKAENQQMKDCKVFRIKTSLPLNNFMKLSLFPTYPKKAWPI